MATHQELRARAEKTEHEAAPILDQYAAAIAANDESRAGELKTQFEAAMASADADKALAKSYADLEARRASWEQVDTSDRPLESRASASATAKAKTAEQLRTEAENAYFRRGADSLTAEQRASIGERRNTDQGQVTYDPPRGGILVSPAFVHELLLVQKAYGPLNDGNIVRYINTASGQTLNYPVLDDTSNKGRMIGETQPTAPTNIVLGSGSVSYTDVITAISRVDPAYRTGPKVGLMVPDSMLTQFRLQLDTLGRPIWAASVTDGGFDTIAGYRYTVNQDLPGMVFGDFNQFAVRFVGDLRVQRLDQVMALYDQIVYQAFFRFDSGLLTKKALVAVRPR